ncbi:mannose-1-phosphate guanylyltransferase/mannose-6-phosphate isomerase [Pseudomonas sp. NW5]|uniref:mannose-1-phosphate guanylyltransferase/mannose-6-phosphate isomerase n=1 Tax=Pseudomonas sp. NW5 TaxID=2934934 RepID=UPI00201FD365|nr:mannose-1-phosphate guanylyltransferase/mannose-6-phosphate isomerase [Pseudomonas sp. NW5]MCL7461854.1 mannose-1-phosphate guanylyltransferase/mannose-6-phosphate isomerase [Pseudomonas sp. NW5]
MKLIPVIMSGGVGSRLWPVSRETHPKPFMTLPDGQTLLGKTFRRAAALEGVVEIMTVTNRELFFKTEDEYRLCGSPDLPRRFILEPFGRNTAAAVACAALQLRAVHGPDALMLVLAADHLIRDEAAFADAVAQASRLAAAGWLVTFGIRPEYPETGFGYIEIDPAGVLDGGFKVSRFVEKPDLATARRYLAEGHYLWNSGMFCLQVGSVLEQFAQHAPDVLNAAQAALDAADAGQLRTQQTLTLERESFAAVPDISIDYALMERSAQVASVPCEIGWSDIGSWSAISALTEADPAGNRCEGEVLLHEARHNYVQSPERLTALVGVEDLIVVDTPDAILVAHKERAQDVKHIVSQLKKRGHAAHLLHRTVNRPWGTYTTLEEGERFKIKRIVVKPGASLSLQMHHHRSEHWVVVSGTARVVNDAQDLLLHTNESTFIRAGHRHRLENPGVIDLVLIEVQSGDYLGEDDIVRFEDVYGRAGQ